MRRVIKSFVIGITLSVNLFAQVEFRNLNFEAAMLQDVEYGMSAGPIASGEGIPSWTPYEGLTPTSIDKVQHNGVSLGGPSIIIHGPHDFFDIIDGDYSLELTGGFGLAAIGQTGTIPVGSKSLLFSGDPKLALKVTFEGESLPVIRLRSGADFSTFGTDVSFFAGKAGELRFTSTSEAYGGIIDDIRFSTVAIPEPASATIMLLGFCLFAGLRCREFRPVARDGAARHGKSA